MIGTCRPYLFTNLEGNRMDNIGNILQAREHLLTHLEEHERSCTKEGCEERANAVAFLAHASGIWTPDRIKALIAILSQYNRSCIGGDCLHVGEGRTGPGSLCMFRPKATLRTVDPKNK